MYGKYERSCYDIFKFIVFSSRKLYHKIFLNLKNKYIR